MEWTRRWIPEKKDKEFRDKDLSPHCSSSVPIEKSSQEFLNLVFVVVVVSWFGLVWFGYLSFCTDGSVVIVLQLFYPLVGTWSFWRGKRSWLSRVFVKRIFYILTVAAGRATVVGGTRQQAVWRSRALILLSFLRLELHSSNSGAHQQPPGSAPAADVLCGSGRYNSLLSWFP
jgi:hypothetical protein